MTMSPMGFVNLLSNLLKGNSGALENVKNAIFQSCTWGRGEWAQLTADKPISQQ